MAAPTFQALSSKSRLARELLLKACKGGASNLQTRGIHTDCVERPHQRQAAARLISRSGGGPAGGGGGRRTRGGVRRGEGWTTCVQGSVGWTRIHDSDACVPSPPLGALCLFFKKASRTPITSSAQLVHHEQRAAGARPRRVRDEQSAARDAARRAVLDGQSETSSARSKRCTAPSLPPLDPSLPTSSKTSSAPFSVDSLRRPCRHADIRT